MITTMTDYKLVTKQVLSRLPNRRDQEIVTLRYGLDMPKRQTLEKIGGKFNITRERVRQIEKSTVARLRNLELEELTTFERYLTNLLADNGYVMAHTHIASHFEAEDPGDHAHLTFLGMLLPRVTIIEESDHFHPAFVHGEYFSQPELISLVSQSISRIREVGEPVPASHLSGHINHPHANEKTIHHVGIISKKMAHLEGKWGLIEWPQVNPRSIRDKTYLVLKKNGKPMHFSEIAHAINNLENTKRTVTVQAVHNELIKDPRFILVGRGIYALSEWGYTPGTVADIITDILKKESPLHKDQIIERVLEKRHVKTTTIILNLQEKDQFVRVAKATYALKQ